MYATASNSQVHTSSSPEIALLWRDMLKAKCSILHCYTADPAKSETQSTHDKKYLRTGGFVRTPRFLQDVYSVGEALQRVLATLTLSHVHELRGILIRSQLGTFSEHLQSTQDDKRHPMLRS